jgi:hypothetical protein
VDDGITGEESCRGVVSGGNMIEGRVGEIMLGGPGSKTGFKLLEAADG